MTVTPTTLALVLTTYAPRISTIINPTDGGKSNITDAKLGKMLKISVNVGRWRW